MDCCPSPIRNPQSAIRNWKKGSGAFFDVMGALKKMIVTGLGTGYLPVAPGTWGSAAVCVIFLAAALGSGGRMVCISGTMAVVALLSAVTAVWLGRFAERTFGKKDPSRCTIDEWAGQAVALIALPLPDGPLLRGCLIAAAVAFVAFRFFDIVKPPPARRMEKLPHGWGVLLDDLVAGVYANVVAQLVLRLAIN